MLKSMSAAAAVAVVLSAVAVSESSAADWGRPGGGPYWHGSRAGAAPFVARGAYAAPPVIRAPRAPVSAGWTGGAYYPHHRHHRGFIGPGFAFGAGVAAGAALAAPYYAGAPYYSDSGYYDDAPAPVAAVPAPADDDAIAACMQTYDSYDPASQTFIGDDGVRYSCP